MLEIKHLTKVYKTKGGEVKALDDVTISFEDRGLVFLLGKSGSGKSTLLNLAGGLDEPTSGEIVVMGRSSKEFSGSDFDSYRNTFVGFVFQEYNVLNEFSVEENVALALELQGKTKDKSKVKAILDEVELSQYHKRKPNTLSGGQKQRIAIARALVKDPQIIMADEPTGALDSVTGRQVFETLKKLSQTRLVLVVSHDREFAEIYGDRIVELSDGKIISDVIKVKESSRPVGNNAVRIGDTLSIKNGAAIDDETMEAIRSFLLGSQGEVIISSGKSEVENFKRINRIDDNCAKERFEATDASKLNIKSGEGAKFIRSRLPASKAIKIGAAGIKLKPFRLLLTVILTVISFIMFGLSSTLMLYNGRSVLIKTFYDSGIDYVVMTKEYASHETSNYGNQSYSYDNYLSALFTPEEVDSLGNAFGVFSMGKAQISNLEIDSAYYLPYISYISEPTESALEFSGKLPKGESEIMISAYTADCLINGMFYSVNENGDSVRKTLSRREDVIGETLLIGGKRLNVSGVFESGAIPSKYDDVKDFNYRLSYELESYLNQGLYMLAFADKSLVSELAFNDHASMGNYDYFERGEDSIELLAMNGDYSTNFYEFAAYDQDTSVKLPVYGTETLGERELIAPFDSVFDLLTSIARNRISEINDITEGLQSEKLIYDDLVNKKGELVESKKNLMENGGSQEEIDEYDRLIEEIQAQIDAAYDPTYQLYELYVERNELQETLDKADRAWNILNYSGYYDENGDWVIADQALKNEQFAFFTELLGDGLKVNLRKNNADYLGEYVIKGFYFKYGYNGLYCSRELFSTLAIIESNYTTTTKYVEEADATYPYIIAKMPHGKEELLLDRVDKLNPDTDVIYRLRSSLYDSVLVVNDLVRALSSVFLTVGIVLAVFSALLLFNFISISIVNKKREIGILRAVGARGIDVFKIFFAESGIIVGICLVLAYIGTFVSAAAINNILAYDAGIEVTMFVFGPLSIVIMLAAALLVTVIATFLPVFLAARKKPVESIRAL